MKLKFAGVFLFSVSLVSLFCKADEATPRTGGTGLAMLPPNVSNPTAEAIGDEELSKRRNAVSTQPFFSKPIPQGDSDFSLLALSSFLESEGAYVLLPKGCVIFCPPELQAKLVKRPKGKPMSWVEFLNANRSWIRCVEVSADQVLGKATVPEEVLAGYRKSKMVIVAQFQGNPITVLTPPQTS